MTEIRFKLDDFDSEVEMWELLNIQAEVIFDLEKENEQLKKENEDLQDEVYILQDDILNKRVRNLIKENEQLKQRNDRQVKQLDRLYQLISQKDWRTLSDIMDDFKRCEEQLQRESGTYW